MDLLRNIGAFSDVWYKNYNTACLIHVEGFMQDLEMYDIVDDHLESYYNGLSIYPIMALENYSDSESFKNYVGYLIRSYRLNQWYSACGFDLIK